MKNKPLILIGGGGHAASLVDILLAQGKQISAYSAPQLSFDEKLLAGALRLQNDEAIFDFAAEECLLINGIGAMPNNPLREKIYTRFKQAGYTFASVVADSAHVSQFATLAPGVQVMNSATLCYGVQVDENTIINTAASIDHDCQIGAHSHIAPGAVLSGDVKVANRVHIATGASIINGVSIAEQCIVGVGANVTKSLSARSIAYGARATVKDRT